MVDLVSGRVIHLVRITRRLDVGTVGGFKVRWICGALKLWAGILGRRFGALPFYPAGSFWRYLCGLTDAVGCWRARGSSPALAGVCRSGRFDHRCCLVLFRVVLSTLHRFERRESHRCLSLHGSRNKPR